MSSQPQLQLHQSKLAFIGGGNMADAIIGGLLSRRSIPKENVVVSEPWEVNRNKLAAKGLRTTTSNPDAAADADVVVLAVKPQVAKTVCQELAAAWAATPRSSSSASGGGLPVVVSIAAGITLDSLRGWARLEDGRVPHVVRVMPNTPALVGEGASGLFAADDVTQAEKDLVTTLMASVSKTTEWVGKEELLDVITGLSGEISMILGEWCEQNGFVPSLFLSAQTL